MDRSWRNGDRVDLRADGAFGSCSPCRVPLRESTLGNLTLFPQKSNFKAGNLGQTTVSGPYSVVCRARPDFPGATCLSSMHGKPGTDHGFRSLINRPPRPPRLPESDAPLKHARHIFFEAVVSENIIAVGDCTNLVDQRWLHVGAKQGSVGSPAIIGMAVQGCVFPVWRMRTSFAPWALARKLDQG